MLNFFYDSLETLKQVKRPTRSEIINMTIAVFVLVIIAWIYFAITDWIFVTLYKQFYNIMK